MSKPDPKDVCGNCKHPRFCHGPDCFAAVGVKFCKCPKFVEAKGKAA